MRIALISDHYPPLRTSGANQLRDLSRELCLQGHDIVPLIIAGHIKKDWAQERVDEINVTYLRSINTRDVSFIHRAIAESLFSSFFLRNLMKSPHASTRFDAIVWYSPTIFLGHAVNRLKARDNCRTYLILRDLFPEWAVDMGLLGRGIPYHYFKAVEAHQYAQADVIGVQSESNLGYLKAWSARPGRRAEVLQNWLSGESQQGCSIRITDTPLKTRKVFVYAGNMGVAQGMDRVINLAAALRERHDVGFLFVGRGTETDRLRRQAKERGLSNVLFHDEIPSEEIPGLYAQCHFGLVALDPRHKTHNLPGKFLTYMRAGLPVLASINPGNDLAALIEDERVGRASVDPTGADLPQLALEMLTAAGSADPTSGRCKELFGRLFSPAAAAGQILRGLRE